MIDFSKKEKGEHWYRCNFWNEEQDREVNGYLLASSHYQAKIQFCNILGIDHSTEGFVEFRGWMIGQPQYVESDDQSVQSDWFLAVCNDITKGIL